MAHQQVAFTIFDAPTAQTLQITGTASTETDRATIEYVFDTIVKKRPYNGAMLLPPVTALKDSGEYVVIRISPTEANYSDYKREIESSNP
jgi:general stress protein 26